MQYIVDAALVHFSEGVFPWFVEPRKV